MKSRTLVILYISLSFVRHYYIGNAAITPTERPTFEVSDTTPRPLELGELDEKLPSPLREFVGSIENINQDVQEKVQGVDPRSVPERLDSWTRDMLGFTLEEIWTGVMISVRWITKTLINLLTWIQSFL